MVVVVLVGVMVVVVMMVVVVVVKFCVYCSLLYIMNCCRMRVEGL
jgi:hypothetical protein